MTLKWDSTQQQEFELERDQLARSLASASDEDFHAVLASFDAEVAAHALAADPRELSWI